MILLANKWINRFACKVRQCKLEVAKETIVKGKPYAFSPVSFLNDRGDIKIAISSSTVITIFSSNEKPVEQKLYGTRQVNTFLESAD